MVSVQEAFSLTFNQSSLVHLSFAPSSQSEPPWFRRFCRETVLFRRYAQSMFCFFLSQTATVMKVILSESWQIRFSVFRLDFHSQFSGSLEGTSCHLFEFCGFRLMTCSSAFYMVSKQVSVLLENSICYRSTRPVFIFYPFHDDIRHSGPVQPYFILNKPYFGWTDLFKKMHLI